MHNCLEIGQIGVNFHLTKVDEYVNRYLLDNFNTIPELCKLPFERLKFLLGSNELKNVREIDLFYQAKTWLEGNSNFLIFEKIFLFYFRWWTRRESTQVYRRANGAN